MPRPYLRVLPLIAAGLVVAGEARAQREPTAPPRLGFGVDFAGSRTSSSFLGNHVGPTIGAELGSWGLLRLRADGTVQLDPRIQYPDRLAVPGTWRGPRYRDERVLKGLAMATVAVEVGTRDRLTTGGPFVAARLGGGLGRWGAGDIVFEPSPWTGPITYREDAFLKPLVARGAEFGVWLPAFGRPTRFALRIDRVSGRDFSTTRLAATVLRH